MQEWNSPRRGCLLIGGLLLALLIFHLAILDNHGFNFDMRGQMKMAQENVRLVTDHYARGDFSNPGDVISKDRRHYGTLFNFSGYLVQYLVLGSDFSTDSLKVYRIALIVLTFFYIAGLAALALAIWAATRSALWAAISIAVLELMPVYFGYGTNDTKDIPFAVMFTLASAVLAFAITRLNQTTRFGRTSLKPALFAGFFIGLAASVRIPGVMLLFHAALAYGLIHWLRHRRFFSSQLIFSCILLALTAFITIWILQPVSWPDPVGWMYDALLYMEHHSHHPENLTNGQLIRSHDRPLFYMLNWLFAPLPLVWFVCALLGAGATMRFFWRDRPLVQSIILLMSLQLCTIPVMAVIEASNLYDGSRHLLFVYPAIAFFATLGIRSASMFRPALWAKIACALIALAAADVAWEMRQLHPYQSSYFNELERHDHMLDYWRVDSWTYADKETAQWLNEHAESSEPIYNTSFPGQINPFLRHNLQIQAYTPATLPYYVLVFSKNNIFYHMDEHFQSCEVAHRVERPMGTITLPLATIYYCTK